MSTTTAVAFTVLGIAAPKGSAKGFPIRRKDGTVGVVVTSDNRNVKGWETMVRSAAQQQCGGVFFEGPVQIAIVFWLPRPASLPRRVTHHLKKPDLDKLGRAVKDALKGILWHDDSQVIGLVARKGYAVDQPRAYIVVDHAAAVEEIAVAQDLFSTLEHFKETAPC